MSTIGTRHPGVFTSPLQAARGVPALPVPGYAYRWSAATLPQADVSTVRTVPAAVGASDLTAVGTERPALATTANGLRNLVIDTDQKKLDTDITPLAHPFTLVVVAKVTTTSGAVICASQPDGATAPRPMVRLGTTATQFEIDTQRDVAGGSIIYHPTPFDTNWHVFIAVFNGADSIFNIDGVETGGALDSDIGLAKNFQFFSYLTHGSGYRGALAEGAIYPFAVPAGGRAQLVSALTNW